MAMLPLDPTTGRFAAKATDPAQHFVPSFEKGKWSHPRLDAPHVHQIVIRENNEVLACDLGNNVVWRLAYAPDAAESSCPWAVRGKIDGLQDGDGARHAVLHPTRRFIASQYATGQLTRCAVPLIYVLNEVSSSLTVHSLDAPSGTPPLARHSLLPPEDESDRAKMTAAEIAFLPALTEGGDALLLCTNRFSTHPEGDSIALFAVSPDGSVRPHGWYRGVGQHVRALDADPSGRYLATAGRDGGGAVILERTGEHGLALKEVARLDVPKVVDALWMS